MKTVNIFSVLAGRMTIPDAWISENLRLTIHSEKRTLTRHLEALGSI
jgi:hypothetical protein